MVKISLFSVHSHVICLWRWFLLEQLFLWLQRIQRIILSRSRYLRMWIWTFGTYSSCDPVRHLHSHLCIGHIRKPAGRMGDQNQPRNFGSIRCVPVPTDHSRWTAGFNASVLCCSTNSRMALRRLPLPTPPHRHGCELLHQHHLPHLH